MARARSSLAAADGESASAPTGDLAGDLKSVRGTGSSEGDAHIVATNNFLRGFLT